MRRYLLLGTVDSFTQMTILGPSQPAYRTEQDFRGQHDSPQHARGSCFAVPLARQRAPSQAAAGWTPQPLWGHLCRRSDQALPEEREMMLPCLKVTLFDQALGLKLTSSCYIMLSWWWSNSVGAFCYTSSTMPSRLQMMKIWADKEGAPHWFRE